VADVITRIAAGVYRVRHDGRNEIVYAAGPDDDRWVFWNGQVYRGDFRNRPDSAGGNRTHARADKGRHPSSIAAPMPARVIRIVASPGAHVRRGDTLLVLEAMKMELPLRAPGDGIVTAIHCQEGELVQADAVLMDLGPS
jgi:biotin carboxyl carrier protein